MEGFWRTCLSQLEKELPAQQFNTWIRPLRVGANQLPEGELQLLAPNRFVLQWVKDVQSIKCVFLFTRIELWNRLDFYIAQQIA